MESVYYMFVGELDSKYENMVTVLSTARLLDAIKTPIGDSYKVTQNMLEEALKTMYSQEKDGLMHLSE
eukprot:71143-Prorocentrum_lima.AAC.1